MKESTRYWLKSMGWTIMQLAFTFLLFYALSRKVWVATVCVVVMILAGGAASKASALTSLARQHEGIEKMQEMEK